MKEKIKRLVCAFLTLLIFILPSCAHQKTDFSETETKEETESQSETEELFFADSLSDLPNSDFEGQKFYIATDSADLIVPSNTTSFVGKQMYLRNRAVEEKYNITLTLTEESGMPTIAERIKTEALAGTSFCDLVLLESTNFQSLAASDSLLNIRSVPYLDLDQSYYNQNSLIATTLGSITYGVAGDFTLKADHLFAVFFNKTMLAQTALPDLYELVAQNQWDLENFLLYSEEVYTLSRANKGNVMGFSSTESKEDLVKVFWAATGFDFLDNPYGERPELIYDHEYTKTFITTAQNLLVKTSSYDKDAEKALNSFTSGATCFCIAPLSSAKQITGRGIDWGIVPIPKLDINQTSYFSYQKNNLIYAGFQKGVRDLTMSGMITSALFASSEDLTKELSLNTYLNLYLNSPEDAEMMQRIMDTPYYDPVEFFGQINASFPASTQTLLYRVISSEGRFDTLFKQYKKMLNNYLDTKF